MQNSSQNLATQDLIPHPERGASSQDWSLQLEMGLDDDRNLYLTLRVRIIYYTYSFSYLNQECVRDVIAKSPIKSHNLWKRQDKIAIGNIMRVVHCFLHNISFITFFFRHMNVILTLGALNKTGQSRT